MNDNPTSLEEMAARHQQEISKMQMVAVSLTASLAEVRDNESGQHLSRIQAYVRILADKLRGHPRFSAYLTPHTINLISMASVLHDIGKIGLPDRVLLNPGRLSAEEVAIMRKHTTIGKEVIERAEQMTGNSYEFLNIGKDIAYTHQEKWDGSGYPRGLRGDEIPVAGRLLALADVYDALVSPRLYRPQQTHDKAVEIIINERGRHFDPDIVAAFVSVADKFRDIYRRFPTTEADLAAHAERLATEVAEQVEIMPVRGQ